ncbi:maleylpyruvate isomerase family mycothiol-dependent enzyme [Nocardioides zhouii]|uniref:maleylpyruvate isomerase family mycothiol-dependent enzyme n=1 Tax=Nocardioides zhouii TaxID=1168729 RepID=UPI0013EA2B1B|nr:maleylpyruvate isomerase family mycothiol-dependent enzyme [Nocardioides zhouii]
MSPALDRSWLDLLRTQAERFAEVVEHGDPAREVTSCPGWTLRDLTDHLGGVHQWAAHAVVEGDPSLEPAPTPAGDAIELSAWYLLHASALIDVLAARPAEAPAWTLDRDNRTAGFWRRRQVHEVTMHLWDAEHALGVARPIDPELAWDGVAEVVDVLYPRQVRLGRTTPLATAVRLTASDLDESVVIGNGDPVDVVAPAEVLLRTLWHREAAREIDPHVVELLSGAVTP